jgi:D-sedoheptulose 7-phosphate isomerase
MLSTIESQIRSSINAKTAVLQDQALMAQIAEISSVIIESYKNNKKTLLAGNGGSAADAQHIAGELVARFIMTGPVCPQ